MKRALGILVAGVALISGCNKEAPRVTETTSSVSSPVTNGTLLAIPKSKSTALASLSGRVTLKGSPPPEKEIPQFRADAVCGKTRSDVPKTRLYVVGAGGELADTFVYVKEGLTGKVFPPAEKPVVLDQVGCEYTPYVFGLRAGQPLVIRNSDPMMHNVSVNSRAGNRSFNEAQMGKGPDKTKTFSNPELFLPFQCNVHPWMFAYGCIVDHPFHAVTDKDGRFELKGLPPGTYVVEAKHRKAGQLTQTITISEKDQAVDFVFELAPTP